MQRPVSYLLSCVILVAAAHVVSAETSPADPYAEARAYIIACSHDWAETVVTGDRGKRKVYFADDFVGTSTSGSRYDKAAIVKETGPAKYLVSNTINNIDIKFYGDTAIAFGDETWRKKDGSSGRYVWTDVWVKIEGEWKIVAAQDVSVAAE